MMSPLLAKHGLLEPVAFGGVGERTVSDLLHDAARVAARLPAPAAGSRVLLAVGGDRYAFVAGLLGTWARGHSAVLPPDAARDWILRLAQRDGTVAVLHDTVTDAPLRLDALLAETGACEPLSLERFTLPDPPVTLYSGDPAGEVRSWPKRRSQLLLEAEALAGHFSLPPGFGVVSSVPPSQQYGLCCGVLWPLVAGGAFGRDIGLATLVNATRARSQLAQPLVLVTVPAHLRALERARPDALAGITRVVCSRAAASGTTSELFGSTATGTIGTREPSAHNGFRPLPGVRATTSETGELLVDAPWLDDDMPRPYATGELVRVDEHGEFFPRGRAGEAALLELERTLAGVAGVDDVVVVCSGAERYAAVVAEPGADEQRLRLQLTAAGPALARTLFLPRLPRTSTGRPRRSRVLEQFGCDATGAPLRFEVAWQDAQRRAIDGKQHHVFHVHIPADYGHFAGHFTGYPILPGAAQLSALVLPCVQQARPELGRLEHMSRIKFSDRIQPDNQIAIGLSWRDAEPTLEFTLHRGATLCASGRLSFAKPEVA